MATDFAPTFQKKFHDKVSTIMRVNIEHFDPTWWWWFFGCLDLAV